MKTIKKSGAKHPNGNAHSRSGDMMARVKKGGHRAEKPHRTMLTGGSHNSSGNHNSSPKKSHNSAAKAPKGVKSSY